MLTLLEVIRRTTEFFAAKGVESARLNAELLVGHALGLKRMQLYLEFERPLTEAELEKIRPLVRRRSQREPLQHIIGEVDFHGLRLRTDRRALIPRPETELLVELVVQRSGEMPRRILDLGTGSGCIALALATKFPDAEITGVDCSAGALELARENAVRCGLEPRVRWVESSWFGALTPAPKFDLIVANPPYLTAAERDATAPEVREFEPPGALASGGADGADDLRTIIEGSVVYLAAGGLLALETGIAQHADLLRCAAQCGYVSIESRADLSGRDRFLFLKAP